MSSILSKGVENYEGKQPQKCLKTLKYLQTFEHYSNSIQVAFHLVFQHSNIFIQIGQMKMAPLLAPLLGLRQTQPLKRLFNDLYEECPSQPRSE